MRAFRRFMPGRRVVIRLLRRGFAFRASALVILAAAIGIPITLSGQASASVTPVTITGFAAAPVNGPAITYGDTTVAVTGRLVESLSQTTGIPDEQIQIKLGTGTAGTAMTGVDGNFSTTLSLPAGGYMRAVFPGDTAQGYGAASTSVPGTLVPATKALTRVTLDAQPTLVPAGTKLTFTGKAEVQVAGSWQPLPGARVALEQLSQSLVPAEPVTDASGAFTSPAITATEFSEWRAEVQIPAFSLYGSSLSNLDMVGVIYHTRIAAASVPATREAHQTWTISGTAQVWNGTTWIGHWMDLSFYYQVQGTSTWVLDGGAQANASGAFSGLAVVRPGHYNWQVRVPVSTGADEFLASASGTYKNFVTDHTCVTGTSVSHSAGRTLVHARIQDWCANGQVTFGQVRGKVVNVYYHAPGSTPWRLIAQPHTDANGFVNYTRYSVLRGYFMVVFPAQGNYLRSASKTVYAG
ncbi:MAG: hypothetical protein J2P30_04890 [Actinobacteria bacterium]|nr:hypothetical protein [Actinomycetota bacterium]